MLAGQVRDIGRLLTVEMRRCRRSTVMLWAELVDLETRTFGRLHPVKCVLYGCARTDASIECGEPARASTRRPFRRLWCHLM